MGTINWSVTSFGRNVGQTLTSLDFSSSGRHISSGTASDIPNLSLGANDILEISSDTNCWINPKGTAAIGAGRPLRANETRQFQASEATSGTVSVIDG